MKAGPLALAAVAVCLGLMIDFDTLVDRKFHRAPDEFSMTFFTPEALTTTVAVALGSAERYVYLWSVSMDWIGVSSQPTPPSEYVQAVVGARR